VIPEWSGIPSSPENAIDLPSTGHDGSSSSSPAVSTSAEIRPKRDRVFFLHGQYPLSVLKELADTAPDKIGLPWKAQR